MNNEKPLVSVIMNCYNSDTYLKEAIDSVISQTYQNWEIIFWDNQSTDKSAEIVKAYSDVRIKYFYASTHTSLGEGRNKALEQVNGDFISFLDCDDILEPKKIELQIKEFLNNSNVCFVYTNGFRIDKNGKYKTKFYTKMKPSGDIFRKALKNYDFYIPAVMIRKQVIDEYNIRFDDRFKLIEEFDFFLKVLEFCEAKYINETLANWRVHEQSDTWGNYKYFSIERELFIESFCRNRKNEFKEEIQAIKDLNLFQRSLVLWKEGKNIKARKGLKTILFKSKKYFLVYLMMFFKYKFLHPLINKIKYMK